MTRDEILLFLRENKSDLSSRYGVKTIGLAGSYARNEARADSDIDIVVTLQSDNKFRSFFNLLHYLEGNLGQKIDLATESSLKPRIKNEISKDICYV